MEIFYTALRIAEPKTETELRSDRLGGRTRSSVPIQEQNLSNRNVPPQRDAVPSDSCGMCETRRRK